MRLGGYRRSGNVDDRRGQGFGGGLVMGGGGLGLVVVVIALLLGVDPRELLDVTGQGQAPGMASTQGAPGARSDDPEADTARAVLASTEDVWTRLLSSYDAPVLVLYDGATDAGACGVGQAAMGPFYCPPERRVYVDLSFYRELESRFGAPGDFAQAYVLAHEVGHHVQTLLGTSDEARRAMSRTSRAQANRISVRLELQADCYAGVWAHHAQGLLDPGDIDEGLAAAGAVGDDRLQRQAQGRVMPDSFTHGTSEQRVRWFKAGFQSGSPQACDTFQPGAV